MFRLPRQAEKIARTEFLKFWKHAALLRLDRVLIERHSPSGWFQALWSECLPLLVSKNDWRRFTMQAYGRMPIFSEDNHNRQLFDWEAKAIDTQFPIAPANVLVAAAGGGREMLALIERGFKVAGFDPHPDFIQSAKKRLSPENVCALEVAGYEELLNGIESIDAAAPYDAILLGWGSLAHVGEDETRRRLFQRLHELCPKGPLLLSWLSPPQLDRTRRKTRRRLQRNKILPERIRDHYDTHLGFIHLFDEGEIRQLAQENGYRIVLYDESLGQCHALLR